MSTFDGLIREFPTVAIDNFRSRPGVRVYLLSHVHSDHLSGLANKAWDAPIYCSQITAKWLPMLATRSKQLAFESGHDHVMERKYAHLASYLVKTQDCIVISKRPLSTDEGHYLDLGNGRNARLRLIPAHHCPGAVMFLLQDDRSCVLYTGDSRNDAVDLQGLKTMPIFSSLTPQIDCLYLDTTYCHPAFQEFPSREFAVSDLVNFINRRPRMAHYYIDAWTFGYEEIWIGLAKAFHTKIHVSPYLYELYEIIDDMITPKVLPHLTLDGTTARFHSCRLGRSCGYGGAGGEHSSSRELIRIQPNVSWFSTISTPERRKQSDSVIAQGQVIGRSVSYSIKERLPSSIGKKDDLCYYINYSCHASLSELQQLVKLVAPRAIFPCVLHRDSVFSTFYRSNRETMALLSNYLPDPALPTAVSKENKNRQYCRNDGITTDFQSFHRAKGFQVLDMNDEILGVTSVTSGPQSSPQQQQQCQKQQGHNTRAIIALTNEGVRAESKSSAASKQPSPMLSPRSNHLRKKMKKLMRQLRNRTSLEEEIGLEWNEEDESTLEEGPLSLDLENIERKRKWWIYDNDRGHSTTLEDHTGGDETDSQNINGQPHSNELVSNVTSQGQQSIVSECKDDGECQQEDVSKGWYDQSTLELVPDMLVFDNNAEEQQEGQLSDCVAQSVESNGYMSSSPDPIFSSFSFTDPSAGTVAVGNSFVTTTLSISGPSSIAASVHSLGEVPLSMAETRHSLTNKVTADVLPIPKSPSVAEITPEAAADVSSSIEYTCDAVSTFVSPDVTASTLSTVTNVKARHKATSGVPSTFVDPDVATSIAEATHTIASSTETTSCVSPSPVAAHFVMLSLEESMMGTSQELRSLSSSGSCEMTSSSPLLSYPRTPLRIHSDKCILEPDIVLGGNPSAADHSSITQQLQQMPTSPTLRSQPRQPPRRATPSITLPTVMTEERVEATVSTNVVPDSNVRARTPPSQIQEQPIRSIFARLVCSPPLRPIRKTMAPLTRAQTDPQHDPKRGMKWGFSMLEGPKRASTLALDSGNEVILIESSEDEQDRGGNQRDHSHTHGQNGETENGCGQRAQWEEDTNRNRRCSQSSQDLAWLEFEDITQEL